MSANYTVSITETGRISGIDYNGVTFGAATPVETSLAEQIQGGVPSPSEDSGNTSTKDSDDTKDSKDSGDGDTETSTDTDGKSGDDESTDVESGDGGVEDRTGVDRGSVSDSPADDAAPNENNEQ